MKFDISLFGGKYITYYALKKKMQGKGYLDKENVPKKVSPTVFKNIFIIRNIRKGYHDKVQLLVKKHGE